MSDSTHEVFIEGETIDLVVPSKRAIDDGWYAWFNDPGTTRWLDQGIFPNSREAQEEFLERITAPGADRLALMILPKGADKVVGIVSISGLNWRNRAGQTALVMSSQRNSAGHMFLGLEAKALITGHAFEVMGIERVWGSQAIDLQDWQRIQVLFGFQPEGILRNAFRKGYTVSDTVITSCLLEDYLRIKEARAGKYWPGKAALFELMRQLPEESIVERVARAIDGEVAKFMNDVRLV